MRRILIHTMIFGALLVPAMVAQNPAPAPEKKEGKIQRRRERQQQRIGEGVENGTLSPAETARLENKQRNLNREIRDDREDHGGKLTAGEKRQINRQQNRLSKQIEKDKHDGVNR